MRPLPTTPCTRQLCTHGFASASDQVYLVYLVLFALARVALSAHFILSPLPAKAPSSLPLYMVLTALVQLVIAHFVWRFYSMLPNTLS